MCVYKLLHINDIAHSCHYPGCGTVLVIDGNMKNRRNICAATEAGYVQYCNLPRSIKTGCQLSPLSTSKYCYHHAPHASAGLFLQERELNSELSSAQPASTPTHEGIVQFILSKKATRGQVYYQVIMGNNNCRGK